MALTATYITTLSTTSNSSTNYDLGNVTVPADGLLVVGVSCRSDATPRSITGVSLGGGAADIVVTTEEATNASVIAAREVQAGDRNVTVTVSGSFVHNCAAHCYLLTGYLSATPVDTDVIKDDTTNPNSLTLDYPENGVGIYVANRDGSGALADWSAAAENFDSFVDTGRRVCANKTASGAGNEETVTFAAASDAWSFLGAVWEPAPPQRTPLDSPIFGGMFSPLLAGI